MNLQAGLPYSLIQNGLQHSYPKLERALRTDVIIVGGGISGALTNFFLTEAGVETVLIDGRTIGLGSTCASTSLIQYEIDVPLISLQKRIGDRNANTAYLHCCRAIHKLHDICRQIDFRDFKFNKSLYYAATKKDLTWLARENAARQQIGLETEWLAPEEIRRRFDFNCNGAILSHTAAYTDAYMLTHALHQRTLSKGSQIFDRTLSRSIYYKGKKVICRTSDGIQLEGNHVVFATGYEAVSEIRRKIVDLHSTYATISDPMFGKAPVLNHDLLIWNTANPYLYLRGTKEGRVIIGGRDEKFSDPTRRNKLIAMKSRALVRDYHRLYPDHPFESEFSWTGTFGSTKDGLPYIGRYGNIRNRYFALGFGGNGITFSVIAAEIIRDMICRKRNPSMKLYDFDR